MPWLRPSPARHVPLTRRIVTPRSSVGAKPAGQAGMTHTPPQQLTTGLAVLPVGAPITTSTGCSQPDVQSGLDIGTATFRGVVTQAVNLRVLHPLEQRPQRARSVVQARSLRPLRVPMQLLEAIRAGLVSRLTLQPDSELIRGQVLKTLAGPSEYAPLQRGTNPCRRLDLKMLTRWSAVAEPLTEASDDCGHAGEGRHQVRGVAPVGSSVCT
jgi:hypothetical protein